MSPCASPKAGSVLFSVALIASNGDYETFLLARLLLKGTLRPIYLQWLLGTSVDEAVSQN